jgi:hypothetical protein
VSRAAVLKVLTDARRRIARHWLTRIEAGLNGHSPLLIGRVDAALKQYVVRLSKLKHPASRRTVLAAMKTLLHRLDKVNSEAQGSLLETDERELLVPVIIGAAAAAGLDPAGFEHHDPTFAFRNF